MSRLTEDMDLSENLLQSCKQNKILTILDFLLEDPEKLSSICKTTFKEIIEVRQKLTTHFSALPVSGTLVYKDLFRSFALVPSGIKNLDTLLNGGFMTNSVVELCGLSGEGKTQLCLSISAHVAAGAKQSVQYLDTKNDFSAHRVLAILKQKTALEEECKAALSRIEVSRVTNIYEVIRFLYTLRRSFREDDICPPHVIIIDSIPALYFPFMGSNTTQGFGLLNHLMAIMKSMATDHHILFIEVNLASTFIETEEESRDSTVGDVRLMLGKYWLHAPNTRLLISKLNNEAPQRLIRVTKSTDLPLNASCIVSVSPFGVV